MAMHVKGHARTKTISKVPTFKNDRHGSWFQKSPLFKMTVMVLGSKSPHFLKWLSWWGIEPKTFNNKNSTACPIGF